MKENVKVLFVNNIPLWYPEHNVARQLQIEVWLNPDMIDLGEQKQVKRDDPTKYYIC
jgi:hypothetical protein